MRHFLVAMLVLAYCDVALETSAVSPAPDGGYPTGNTTEGNGALFSITNGGWNTALGYSTLHSNTSGSLNTAVGFDALFKNAAATGNTATGFYALFSNTTGYNNTADGSRNTALGYCIRKCPGFVAQAGCRFPDAAVSKHTGKKSTA
jgi:hypothetical protein